MYRISLNNEKRDRVKEWFERNQQPVTTVQFLLALEYLKNYGYTLDVACPLAMESYKINIPQK
jgi:hypothetical protein